MRHTALYVTFIFYSAFNMDGEMVTANLALGELADRYWEFERYEFPLNALLAGQSPSDATVFRESQADYARKDAAAADMLGALAEIDAGALCGEDQATHALLRHELTLIRDLYRTGAHLRPSVFPVGPDFNTIFLANSTALTTRADAQAYLARLETLPGFIEDLIDNFDAGLERGYRYPRVVLERAIAVVDGYLSGAPETLGWYGPFKRSPSVSEFRTSQRRG